MFFLDKKSNLLLFLRFCPVLCFLCPPMPSKEKDDAVDSRELDLNYSGHRGSDSGAKELEVRGQDIPKNRGEDIPWEKRYEKLWVEVEKKEAKSTFMNVAEELKEKFGELFKSRRPAESLTEEQATAGSPEEESSDDEEGEVIVRPTARARSTVLLTIPEQRESGLEDSESTDNSLSEDRMAASISSFNEEPDLLTDDALESPSSQHTAEHKDSVDNIYPSTRAFSNDRATPVGIDHSLLWRDETEQHVNPILKDTTAHLSEAEKHSASSEDDFEEFTRTQPPSLRRRSASIPGVSDEEVEDDKKRFKFEVGMLKAVFFNLEKEKSQLQKEVEDGRPSHTSF